MHVPLKGLIDLEQERERLRADISEKKSFLESVEGKLANEQFVEKAPDEIAVYPGGITKNFIRLGHILW